MMTNGDGEKQIFLSHPHTPLNISFYIGNVKKASKNPEYAVRDVTYM